MVKERDGILGRLRGALRPAVVAPEAEYVRRSPEERRAALNRAFGLAEPDEDERTQRPEDAPPTRAEA
jgi:hypothetical protein